MNGLVRGDTLDNTCVGALGPPFVFLLPLVLVVTRPQTFVFLLPQPRHRRLGSRVAIIGGVDLACLCDRPGVLERLPHKLSDIGYRVAVSGRAFDRRTCH